MRNYAIILPLFLITLPLWVIGYLLGLVLSLCALLAIALWDGMKSGLGVIDTLDAITTSEEQNAE